MAIGKDRFPVLLVGIRQCGKSESVKEFAKRNDLDLIELNFWEHKEYCADFSGSLEVNDLILKIPLRFPNKSLDPEKPLFSSMRFKTARGQDYPSNLLKLTADIK